MRDWITRPLIMLACIVSMAEAQIVRVTSESEPRTICRIVNGFRECSEVTTTEFGTGTIVDRFGGCDYVLTAKHVLPFERVAVHGRPATVVAKHESEDIALLKVKSTGWNVAKIAQSDATGTVYLDGLGGSGESDTSDHRQVKASVAGRWVDHPSRMGDSGGPVSKGRTVLGVISQTTSQQTRIVPASICLPFCQRYGVCRPPKSQRVAPLPEPPRDVPDIEKTARIERLEKIIEQLQAKLKTVTAERGPAGPRGTPGKDGATGPPGKPGRDGADGRFPLEIRVVSVADDGSETVVSRRLYQPGEPINLRFHEKLLRGE